MWPFKKKPLEIGKVYCSKRDPWGMQVVVKDLKMGWVRYSFLDEGKEMPGKYSLSEESFRYCYK